MEKTIQIEVEVPDELMNKLEELRKIEQFSDLSYQDMIRELLEIGLAQYKNHKKP